MNERYNINVEVVTPLAVGAGTDCDWIQGVDYVVKNKKAYILDLQKAVLNGVDVDKLAALLATSDEKGICDLLGGQLEALSRYIFDLPELSCNPIKAFLRNQLHDKPIVAGSSLKGAIRSMLFTYLRQEGERDNQSVFGKVKDGTDFMRFIQVGDIEMDTTQLVNTRIFNLWKEKTSDIWHGGWKHGSHSTSKEYLPMGFNTLYECVGPGMSGNGIIKFSKNGFMSIVNDPRISEMGYVNEKNAILDGGAEKLFGIINHATRNYLLKEKEFFEKYKEAERTKEILNGIEDLLTLIPQNNSYCIMKMSAGSGFHSITGDWQNKDYLNTGLWRKSVNGDEVAIPKYKSRKIAEFNGKLLLMGFIKLTVI